MPASSSLLTQHPPLRTLVFLFFSLVLLLPLLFLLLGVLLLLVLLVVAEAAGMPEVLAAFSGTGKQEVLAACITGTGMTAAIAALRGALGRGGLSATLGSGEWGRCCGCACRDPRACVVAAVGRGVLGGERPAVGRALERELAAGRVADGLRDAVAPCCWWGRDIHSGMHQRFNGWKTLASEACPPQN